MVDVTQFSPELTSAYRRLMDIYGGPLPAMKSGYRDPDANKAAGGASGSQHLHRNAIDWATSGMSQEDRMRFLDAARQAGFQGFGGYSSGNIHTDVGPARYWGDDYSGKSAPQWLSSWFSGSPQMRVSTKDAPMTPTQPKTLWERLTSTGERSGLNPMEAFAAALDPLILPSMRAGSVIREQGAQRAKFAKDEKTKNATLNELRKRAATGDKTAQRYLDAVISGALDPKSGFSGYLSEAASEAQFNRSQAAAASELKRKMDLDTAQAAKVAKMLEEAGYPQLAKMVLASPASTSNIMSSLASDIIKPPEPKAPKTMTIQTEDGGEVAVQWDEASKNWVPLKADVGVVPGPKKMTESQAKTTLFNTMQNQTAPVLNELETRFDPANIPDAAARSVPIAGNFFSSTEGQIYQAAAEAWAEGALRIATGAAATPDEKRAVVKTYFAQPGDTPATIEFKRQLREAYNTAIQASLGQATNFKLSLPTNFAKDMVLPPQQNDIDKAMKILKDAGVIE